MRFNWFGFSMGLGVSVFGAMGAIRAQAPAPPPAGVLEGSRIDVGAMKQLITLNLSNASLSEALRSITRQSGIDVLYEEGMLEGKSSITVRKDKITVEDAIVYVLNETGIRLVQRPSGKYVLVSDARPERQQKEIGVIAGRVIDSATQKGVAGVTVTVSGSKLNAMTIENGRYTLPNVPVGTHTVNWRLMGYKSVTRSVSVTADKQATVNVVMSASATMLSGIVTTVTGTQKKLEIGTDVTSIDVEKVLRTAPISNVTDLLETRVPGLIVQRTSGVPGAPSRLRFRGPGGGLMPNTPGAPTNDPIVVVDGIRVNAGQSGVKDQSLVGATDFPPPSPIDQIDVNSIDKIDVYKGPSATALYGADAANGVIVITTKRGKSGQTRWSMTAKQELQYLPGVYAKPGYYPFCNNGGGGVCGLPSASSSGMMLDSIVRFQALDESRLTPFGTGSGNGVTATVSGGTQAVSYSITGSTTSQLGLLKMPSLYQDLFRSVFDSAVPNWMRRPNTLATQGVNSSFVIQPRSDLRATLLTRLTKTKQRQSSAQLQLPDLAGRYIDTTQPDFSELRKYVTRIQSSMMVSDIILQVNLDRWRLFPVSATTGLSRESRDETQFVPRGIPNVEFGNLNSQNQFTKGAYANGIGITDTRTSTVNGTVFPGNRISVAVGAQIRSTYQQQYRASVDSIPAGVISPANLTAATQYHLQSASGGWFVEPRLNLNSRFFVNPGFRFDGGGNSGMRGGVNGGFWSLFPKLNFSWIAIDREGETPFLGAISMFRPRVAFGVAGVQPAPGWKERLLTPSNLIGTNVTGPPTIEATGLALGTIGNTQLRPERTREVEFGGDLDLWNGRMQLAATFSDKVRTDAILGISIAPSVYSSGNQFRNIGRIRNVSTEVTFSFIPVESPMLSVSVNGSLSKVKNTLVSLNNGQDYIDLGGGTRLVPGYPVSGRWELPLIGYSQPTVNGHLTKQNIVLGDTAVYMGQQSPNFSFPFSMGASVFHGLLSFNVGFMYEDGLTQLNAGSDRLLINTLLNPDATLAEQAAALGWVGSEGVAGDILFGTDAGRTRYGLIQTVNTFRFKSLSLGYTIPRTFAKRFGVPSIRIEVQGNELGLWTNYRGKDPNVNSATVGERTLDNGALPVPRTWRLQFLLGN